jgi:hypothetical protein
LQIYGKGSGQLVNQDKSAIFFSKNCDADMKIAVEQGLDIPNEALAEKYLGLLTTLGRSAQGAFEYLPAKVKSLVGCWSGRDASCAGREVLLKSVAQALPTYPMSCFLIPNETCKKIKTTIANYWWGSSADSRHLHWMKWERLTSPKVQGGMGFHDLHLFNRAMLGKQAWKLIERPESLCARVLKGRYFHDVEFLSATRRKHASQTWRAILAGGEVLQQGLIKRLGSGESTKIWEDRWIPNHFNGKPITPSAGQEITYVADLLTASGQWNEEIIKSNFFPVDAEAILKLPLRGVSEDIWAWEPEKHGVYSVKLAYRLLYSVRQRQVHNAQPSSSGDIDWKLLWKLEVPPKVSVFW